ncbi:hypothetical protein N7530_010416 [Penicillium desertorum]|uniref:NAD-dependent epimerase/dehydratase domain-containing protein n=1 Tax=Penicillium desertorum TaxID=1303715 RepID=A0A9W9WHJ7_9EURO|nr:hypothetical protein N7530_010416 [Penicillium desertorum]
MPASVFLLGPAVADYANLGVETVVGDLNDASVIKAQVAGEHKSDTIFDDEKPEEINALPDSASHRLIDLEIIRAGQELASHAKMAIMIPPLIYGVTNREKRLSIQLPTLVRYSIKHGYAGQIGKGLAVWNQIHVKDLARGYMVLLHWMERAPVTEIALSPYFFCENGQELSWGECAAEIGRTLKRIALIDEVTSKPIPKENWGDLFGDYSGMVVGSNVRHRANRLRKLGWAPLEKDTLASLAEDEIPIIAKETGEFTGYASVVAS